MKIIKCLSEKIQDELDDADDYIDLAIKWKPEYPGVADLLYQLSLEEMVHMKRLHDKVAEIIADYRRQTGEPPSDMMAVYNYLHEKFMASATEIKIKQGLFKS